MHSTVQNRAVLAASQSARLGGRPLFIQLVVGDDPPV